MGDTNVNTRMRIGRCARTRRRWQGQMRTQELHPRTASVPGKTRMGSLGMDQSGAQMGGSVWPRTRIILSARIHGLGIWKNRTKRILLLLLSRASHKPSDFLGRQQLSRSLL